MSLEQRQHLEIRLEPRWSSPLLALVLWWQIGLGRVSCPTWIRIKAANVVLSGLLGVAVIGGGWWFVNMGLMQDAESLLPNIEVEEATEIEATPETDMVDLDVFRRSSLFSSLRRSDRSSREPRTNPVELLEMLELKGVLGGENPRAIIVYKQTRQAHTVFVGDMLGEFEIMEIKPRSVMLKWREDTFELSL